MSENRRKILSMLAEGKISVDEADRLLSALAGQTDGPGPGPGPASMKKPKYLRVLVRNEAKGENVNIRVPLAVIRAGIKLGSIIPDQARVQVDSALKDKGIQLDLSKADPETVEELVAALSELEVDIKAEEGETVRVFCE